jgi:hypothetical protein
VVKEAIDVKLALVKVNELNVVVVVVLWFLNESDVVLTLKSEKVIGMGLVLISSKKEVVLLKLVKDRIVVSERENSVKVEIEADVGVIIFIDETFLGAVSSCIEVVELCLVSELNSEVKGAVTTLFEASVVVMGEDIVDIKDETVKDANFWLVAVSIGAIITLSAVEDDVELGVAEVVVKSVVLAELVFVMVNKLVVVEVVVVVPGLVDETDMLSLLTFVNVEGMDAV